MALSSNTVHHRLRHAARSLRWTRCLRQALAGGVAAAIFLVLFLILDVTFHLGAAGRWTGFLLILGSLGWAAGAAIFSAFQPVSEAGMARRIESSCEDSGNVLISAVQLDGSLPQDSPLRAMIFKEMRDPFPRVDWKRVFDLRLLQKLGLIAAAIVLVLAAWAAFRPAYLANAAARVLMPASRIDPLTRTRIVEIQPGDAQAVRGKPVFLRARLAGDIPKVAWIQIREEGADWRRVAMEHEAGSEEFRFSIPAASRPVDYRIHAGDAVSDIHHISLRPRTAIAEKSAQIEPPAYTRLAPQEVRNFTSLQNIPAGSRVTLRLHFNAPLKALTAGGTEVKTLGPQDWEIRFTPEATGKLSLSYADTDDVADTETLSYAVNADDPPKLSITSPPEGKELLLSPENALHIRFEAADAIGLGSVTLYRSTADSQTAEPLESWPAATGKINFTAEATILLSKYKNESQVSFCLEAKDQNDVTGPGVTLSRPLVVTLKSSDEVQKQAEKLSAQREADLRGLIELQQTNLQQTLEASRSPQPQGITDLMERQDRILRMAERLASSLEATSPQTRGELQALLGTEMPAAVAALRDAINPGPQQAGLLNRAIQWETTILMRLKGAGTSLAKENVQARIADLIAGLEDLLRRQREIARQSSSAAAEALKNLSEPQDALSEAAGTVRKSFDAGAKDATVGDQDFRDKLARVAAEFGTFRIYEDMVTAAEELANARQAEAVETQSRIIKNLAAMLEAINRWRLAAASKAAEDLQKAARELVEKLEKLETVQKEVVEKSQELARKGGARPEDEAIAEKLKELKAPMPQTVEQMLTDAHVFPDLQPCNDLRSQLTEIYEDVQQSDKEDVASGSLEAKEIAVQKQESLLKAMAEAKDLAADMEMWLPDKNETEQWHLENFDTTELPDIALPPLPDAFEDLVGDLLEEQSSISDQVQDASSNQLLSQNPANGWSVSDGPMGSFGAQGKSGNQRPNQNEQMGRSSGGREGMTTGEMVGDTASNLEGRTPDARRTEDPFQQGQVRDDAGLNHNQATGGGKAGGLSDQAGMEGNAPLRPANAPRIEVQDALAVQQALLAEKTARTYANASLLYLKANRLADTSELMEQSRQALKEGRIRDFQSIHRKILGSLRAVQGDLHEGNVVALPVSESSAGESAPVSGDDGQVPARYRDAVADYYRSLVEER